MVLACVAIGLLGLISSAKLKPKHKLKPLKIILAKIFKILKNTQLASKAPPIILKC